MTHFSPKSDNKTAISLNVERVIKLHSTARYFICCVNWIARSTPSRAKFDQVETLKKLYFRLLVLTIDLN